jgi:lipopolysaccharide transport system permease protein
MTGTVLWTAFNSAVMAMQGIMAEARGTLSKVNFPHEALILAGFGKSLLNSVPPVVLLIPALLLYGAEFNLRMLLFPVGFLGVILLGCALGLVFVPIGALYGDVGRAIQLGLRFGFFVTPVIYALPESGLTRTLMIWNPVTAPLVSGRSWLIGGEAPLVPETILVCVASLLVLILATVAFKVAMPHLIERLNS